MRVTKWIIAAPVFMVLLSTQSALGDSSTASARSGDTASAEELFRLGREAMSGQNWTLARERFKASYALEHAVGTLLNLAICEENLGRLAIARENYREVLAQLPFDDDRGPIAELGFKRVDARVPRLNIRLEPGAATNVSVSRNGLVLPASSLNLPLPIEVGSHLLLVTANGHESRTYEVQVREGERRELSVSPGPSLRKISKESNTAPRAPAAESGWTTKKTAGWALIGTGVAAVGSGLVAGLLAANEKSIVEDECRPEGTRSYCNQPGLDAGDRGKLWANLSTLGVGIGLSALGAGSFLLFVNNDESSRRSSFVPTTLGVKTRF